MKPYSLDLREKIVHAVEAGESSIRKTAQRFSVSKSCVQKLLAQKRTEGHLNPHKQGGSKHSSLLPFQEHLLGIVQQYPDATLAEYCEYLGEQTGLWVSQSTLCRTLQRLKLPRKKNTAPSASLQPSRSTSTPRVLATRWPDCP